jgi:hypothetical protein
MAWKRWEAHDLSVRPTEKPALRRAFLLVGTSAPSQNVNEMAAYGSNISRKPLAAIRRRIC